MANLRLNIDPTGVEVGGRRAESALDRLKREARETAGAVDRSSDRMGRSVESFGVKAGRAIGIAAAAFLSLQTASQSITLARNFNASLSETTTLIQGTDREIKELTASSREMARQFGGSATEQMKAFYQAISAGAGDVMDATVVLDQANRLAIGGVTDITTAVDALTTATNAYAAQGLTAAEASDAMFIAIRAGKTTAAELGSQLGNIVPLASSAGVSFDELTAAIAALTTQGQSTSIAVTGIRQVIAGVLKPTSEAVKLSKELGLAFNAEALEAKGLSGFLQDVIEKTGGSQEQMAKLFGSVEALNAVLAFSGGAGGKFADVLDQMETKAGATDEAFEKMSNSLDQRWNRAVAAGSDIVLTLGNALLTVAVPALEAAASAIDLVAQNGDVLAISIGLLAATRLPALVASLINTVAWLGTMQGLFISGAVAARGLAVAMNLIPGVALFTGLTVALTGIYRGFVDSKQAAADFAREMGELEDVQNRLNSATERYYNQVSQANLDAMLIAAQNARAQVAEALETAKAELESASFTTNFFGTNLYETERMAEAKAAISDLEVELIEAETRLSAAEHAAANFRTTVSSAAAPTIEMSDSIKGIAEASFTAVPALSELHDRYGDIAGVIRDTIIAQNELAVTDGAAAIRETLQGISELSGSLGLSEKQAADFEQALANIGSQTSFAVQADMALGLAAHIERAAGGVQNMTTETRAAYRALLDAAGKAGELAAVSGQISFSGAASTAANLAKNLGISLNLAQRLANVGVGSASGGQVEFDPRSPQFDPEQARLARVAVNMDQISNSAGNVSEFDPSRLNFSTSSGGGGGGGGGGGASQINQTKEAYDALMASLDPVIRATQQFEEAQNTINEALEAGHISATEAAEAYDLAKDRFDDATASVGRASSVWASLERVGGNAIDNLIAGTGSLKDAVTSLIRELVVAITKKNLLGKIKGGTASDSLGSLIFKGLFGGFLDKGGVISQGQFAVVGERGPELVQSTSRGAVVTSRAETARQTRSNSQMDVNLNVSVDDEGKIKVLVDKSARQAAQAGAEMAVSQVRSSWGSMNQQFETDGVLA